MFVHKLLVFSWEMCWEITLLRETRTDHKGESCWVWPLQLLSWMNVCMYVCMYVCRCMYMSASVAYVCMYVCMYVCSMHVCFYVCMYPYGSIYMYICMYVCMYVCMYPHVDVCVCNVCMCVFACVGHHGQVSPATVRIRWTRPRERWAGKPGT